MFFRINFTIYLTIRDHFTQETITSLTEFRLASNPHRRK